MKPLRILILLNIAILLLLIISPYYVSIYLSGLCMYLKVLINLWYIGMLESALWLRSLFQGFVVMLQGWLS